DRDQFLVEQYLHVPRTAISRNPDPARPNRLCTGVYHRCADQCGRRAIPVAGRHAVVSGGDFRSGGERGVELLGEQRLRLAAKASTTVIVFQAQPGLAASWRIVASAGNSSSMA